jgi:hypothetical protein
MITIEAYPNYMGEGKWHFEAECRKGHYELDLYPHLFLYSLLFPDGTKEEGSISSLISKLKYMHQDPELNAWLIKALDFKKSDPKPFRWEIINQFEIDGIEYGVCLNPDSGEMELRFPARTYVCKRSTMINDFPELFGVCKCALSNTLIDILYEKNPKCSLPKNQHLEQLAFNEITEYDLEGTTAWIAYNKSEDVFLIHLDPRKVLGHALTISSDLWEFEALHNGKYKSHIEKLINNEFKRSKNMTHS